MSQTSILAERAPESTGISQDRSGQSMTGTQDLTSVLVSRICHDLVSPVGAIVNGVDLVREIGGGDVEAELAMISQSSKRASALLQYYRIAFGAASDDSEISRNALHEQATAFLTSPRILLDWTTDNGPHLSRPLAKLLLQMLLCAKGMSGMRGMLSVQMSASETLPMSVTIESDGGPETSEMLACIKGESSSANISPRLVEFALTRATAEAFGLQLQVTLEPGRISITVA